MQDLYINYLLTQNKQATSTGLAALLDNKISHDQVTRFLNREELKSKNLWTYVKRKVSQKDLEEEGVLIFDDTISEKTHTKENDINSWHYDHGKGRCVKGINLLTCFYNNNKIKLPISYEIIKKDNYYKDSKTGKEKRKSKITKNEHVRNHLRLSSKKNINFKYVLADNWFSSKDNMKYIEEVIKKYFIMGLKSNRLIKMYNSENETWTNYLQLKNSPLKPNRSYLVKLKGYDITLNLVKKVFKNGDGSVGTLYLVSNDLELNSEALYNIYKKRWVIEEFHKKIKNHASLSKSPTKLVKTQSNHIYMSYISYCKFEVLKNMSFYKNQNQIKELLLIRANQAAMAELVKLQNSIKIAA